MISEFQIFPAPAKVNLFLHIVGQRPDGYHLLQSVFRLLDFHDDIRLRPRRDGVISRTQEIAGVAEEDDLCLRAAHLLQQHTGSKMGIDIAVDKRIPMGGGLGGGSSDAATVLLALNRMWDLHLPRTELQELGLQLGADVPIFIFGENAWAEGVGEKLQPIMLKPAYYVVLTPSVHVSTAQVFASKELTRNTIPTTIAAFSGVTPENEIQSGLFRNDLESVVCRQYPAVATCLKWLNQFSQARMSGSGASVFVELENQAKAELVIAELAQDRKLQNAGFQVSAFLARGLDKHPLYNYAD